MRTIKTLFSFKAFCCAVILPAAFISIADCEEPVKVKEARQHYFKAGEFMEAAKNSNDPSSYYSRAIEEFKISLYLNPDNANVQYSMGGALKKLDRCSEALAYYERSFELAAGFKPEEAARDFQIQVLSHIAECYKDLNKKEDFYKTLSRKLELMPVPNRFNIYSEISLWYLQEKNLSLAKKNVISALESLAAMKALEPGKRSGIPDTSDEGIGFWQRNIRREWDSACKYRFSAEECAEGISFPSPASLRQGPDLSKEGLINAIQAVYKRIDENNYYPYFDTQQLYWKLYELLSLYVKEGDYEKGFAEYQRAKSSYPLFARNDFKRYSVLLKILLHYHKWDELLNEIRFFYDPNNWHSNYGLTNSEIEMSTSVLKAYLEHLKAGEGQAKSGPGEGNIVNRWLIVLDENSLVSAIQLKDGKPDPYGSVAQVGRDNYGAADNTYRFLAEFKIPELPKSVVLEEALLYAPSRDFHAEIQCLNVLDESAAEGADPKHFEPATSAEIGQTHVPGGSGRSGLFDVTKMAGKWIGNPSQSRRLMLKEFNEDNIYKRDAWSFDPSKLKLILIVSAGARPSVDSGEVLECVETWDSNYYLVWQDLSRGDTGRAYKRLESVRDMVAKEDLRPEDAWYTNYIENRKRAIEKQLSILRDYVYKNSSLSKGR